MENILRNLYPGDIKMEIDNITHEASKFKKKAFLSILKNEELEPAYIRRYLGAVNKFLKYWDDYSIALAGKMRSSNGDPEVYTVEYPFIKEYIYAKYDFASVLPFADGLVKGISDNKFNSVEDIEDFRDHTISKAFDGLPSNAAGVLDRVVNPPMGVDFHQKAEKSGATSFNVAKTYDMFNARTRSELYRATEKTINFITYDLRYGKFPNKDNLRIFVSMINNIIDYITYSLTAYSCRIYIIAKWALPFTSRDESKEYDRDYSESGNNESTRGPVIQASSNDNNTEVTIMRELDDTVARDVSQMETFFDAFENFLGDSGATSLFKNAKIPHFKYSYESDCGSMEDNFFGKDLRDNDIEMRLFRYPCSLYPTDMDEKDVAEIAHSFKGMLYNSAQGMEGSSSAKQELLHIIRGTENGDTLNNYLELARDLYLYAMRMALRLKENLRRNKDFVSNSYDDSRYSVSTKRDAMEILKMINEFYGDFMLAVLYKARDLEMKINNARNAVIAKTMDMCTFKIPELDKSDACSNNNMMSAVPDTTRMPIDLMDTYAIPSFESMELNDDLLRYLPEFANDIYFSEAFNISQGWNAVKSKLVGLWRKIQNFFNDKKFKEAVKWVTSHKNNLMNMDVSGAKLQVYPYKIDITLPDGFENLINNLSNIPDKALENDEALDKWIKSLYPNETVYGWFNNGENGALKYRNLFLFQDANEVDDKHHEVMVNIGDTQIAKNLGGWINTIEQSDNLFRQLQNLESKVENALNSLKAKAAGVTNKLNSQSNSNNNSTALGESTGIYLEADGNTSGNAATNQNSHPITAQGAGTSANAAGNTPQTGNAQPAATNQGSSNNTSSQPNTGVAVVQRALKQVDIVIAQLYTSLLPMIVEYLRAEYKYIKDVYTQVKK